MRMVAYNETLTCNIQSQKSSKYCHSQEISNHYNNIHVKIKLHVHVYVVLCTYIHVKLPSIPVTCACTMCEAILQ